MVGQPPTKKGNHEGFSNLGECLIFRLFIFLLIMNAVFAVLESIRDPTFIRRLASVLAGQTATIRMRPSFSFIHECPMKSPHELATSGPKHTKQFEEEKGLNGTVFRIYSLNLPSINSSTFSIVAFEIAINQICVTFFAVSTGSFQHRLFGSFRVCRRGDWEFSDIGKIEQLMIDGGQS